MRYLWALVFFFSSAAVGVACSAGGNNQFTTSTGTTAGTGGSGGAAGAGGSVASSSSSSGDPDGGFMTDAQTDSPACTTPVTCADVGANCGPISDGCGGIIDCGTCTAPQTCGGGGTPSVCGGTPCIPTTCAAQNANCGPIADGCGGLVQCGTCTAPDTCGGGGFPGVCGQPACVPLTCAQLGSDCGLQGDGCGGIMDCGVCIGGKTCGGAGQPGVCGTPNTCTNLCLKQVTCSNPNVTTTLSGTVYAPNGIDPLLNALVYVPNAPVSAFQPGVACETCGTKASGSPLVSAVSGVDGKFTIKNVPVGANIPVVIQLGRWRRQFVIPSVAACIDNPIPAAQTRLPRNKTEGDIPLIAFATGSLDSLECVFRQIGVSDSEFTAGPNGTGRIHLYTGSGSSGATIAGAQSEDVLTGSPTILNKYDMVFLPCQGFNYTKSSVALANMLAYANAGGRVFTTHYGYGWLYQNGNFAGTANWAPDSSAPVSQTGSIDMTFPKGQALAQWLVNVGASTVLGQIPVDEIRHDSNSTISPTQTWMTVPSPSTFPVHFTFNTPISAPAAQQCGRVLYDDFHVFPGANGTFPAECSAGSMTPQGKLLEFMIFDLASCVTPDMPVCTPKTCQQLGATCGQAGDGCGGVLNCGTCPAGQTCGGGGTPSQCGSNCTPKTCAQLQVQCGPAGDGCGNLIQCGTCPVGQTCGGGGMPGVCGNQTCTPKTCAQLGIQCGPAGDGCGGLLQCGNCPAGQTCGGGGTPGVCGAPMCTPKTCAQLGFDCGPAADGCGGLLQCGTCQIPATCGGGGMANVCGGSGPH